MENAKPQTLNPKPSLQIQACQDGPSHAKGGHSRREGIGLARIKLQGFKGSMGGFTMFRDYEGLEGLRV